MDRAGEDAAMSVPTIHASGLSDFLDCAARAEAKHLLGLKTPSNSKSTLGRALHKSTAVYDQSRIDKAGITISESAGAAVDAIRKPNEEVVFEEDMPADLCEEIAIALHHRYCEEIAPSIEYAGVEIFCERLEITDIGIALTGTTDRIRKLGDEGAPKFGISDIKSGKTAVKADGSVKTHGHSFQIGVYELLADKASGVPITEPGQIIGLQVAKTERGQRVAVSHDIVDARSILVGDGESPGVLETVAHMIHSGNFPGNPRSMLCHERYCPIFQSCKFRR
jgi:PD-(D/E)XK nuclease superfamily